jgi:hypothetical protein
MFAAKVINIILPTGLHRPSSPETMARFLLVGRLPAVTLEIGRSRREL